MPKATQSSTAEQYDLDSCPGGYVRIRKFTYGEILRRRELGMRMTPGDGSKSESKVEFTLSAVQEYEFSKGIVEHNLENEDGRLLNFNNKADVLALDSEIAQEIEKIIQDLNDPEADTPSKSRDGQLDFTSKESAVILSGPTSPNSD